MAELQLTGEVPSEAELMSARERRDYGWKLLRLEWLDRRDIAAEKKAYASDHELPDVYEQTVVVADQVADRLRRESDRVVSQASLMAEQAKLENNLKQLENQKTGLEERLDQLQMEWRQLWVGTGIVPLPPKEMRSWIIKHRELVHVLETVRNFQLEAAELEDIIAAHRAELGQELVHLGEPEPLPEETLEKLLYRCQKVVDMAEGKNREKQDLQKKITEIEGEIKEANQEKVQARQDLENWQINWSKAIHPLGLSGETSPAAVHAVMAKVDELFQKIQEAASLQIRIQGINQDALRFTEDATALVKQLAPDQLDIPPDHAAAGLQARLSQAQADGATETALRKQLKEKQHIIRASQDTVRLMTESLAKLCRQADCRSMRNSKPWKSAPNSTRTSKKTLTTWRSRSWNWLPGPPLKGSAGKRPR